MELLINRYRVMNRDQKAWWGSGPPINADAEEVWGQLKEIREMYEDGITPDNVVEHSRNEDTPLHPVIFEHSDEKAAHLYRKRIARRVIQTIEVEVELSDDHREPTRAFVNVRDHDGKRKYKPTQEVLEDEDLREQALEQVLESIIALREKHSQYERLSEILVEAKNRIQAELGLTERDRTPTETTNNHSEP